MSKNKNFSTKLAAFFISIALMSFASIQAVFAADAPPSINFSFDSDDAPPSLGPTPTPSPTATTPPPRPVLPPAPKPTRTVSAATPKKVTKTGPGLLYPILLGVGSLYYFRKRQKA